MSLLFDYEWYKHNVEPLIIGYEIIYRYFPEGDFGSLHQIAFESSVKCGEIDFWSSGVLEIGCFDMKINDQAMNVLIFPNDENEYQQKENAFEELLSILLSNDE